MTKQVAKLTTEELKALISDTVHDVVRQIQETDGVEVNPDVISSSFEQVLMSKPASSHILETHEQLTHV